MGRPLRLDPEMGIHHVYTRGTKRWALFHNDSDRLHFMGTLSRVSDRYGLEVLAFCLMDNHFHLVVQCPNAHLSDSLRDLKSTYARTFNRRHRSSGPIFEDRFGSRLITTWVQLRNVVRYVHRNPYSIDPAMDLGAYRWSSHRMYLGRDPAPAWLLPSVARPLFADYRAEVETAAPNDAVQNERRHNAGVDASSEGVPGTPSLAVTDPSLAEILIAVAQVAGTSVDEVHPRRRNGLVGIAVLLAFDDFGYTSSEIAEPFGFRTPRAVQSSAVRARRKAIADGQPNHFLMKVREALHRHAA